MKTVLQHEILKVVHVYDDHCFIFISADFRKFWKCNSC